MSLFRSGNNFDAPRVSFRCGATVGCARADAQPPCHLFLQCFEQTSRRFTLMGVGALLLLLTGCGILSPATLRDVSVAPDTISPNADGREDIAVIRYLVGQPAHVSIWLEDEAGQRYIWRDRERRSPGNTYESWFWGGVDQQVLPDGRYELVVMAEPIESGPAITATHALTITNGDRQVPTIQGLTIAPPIFTPNRDGVGDRVKISYNLAKEAAQLRVSLMGPDGQVWLVPEDEINEATAAGPHIHDFDGGIDLSAEPPPDGLYTLVVEAEDRVGNKDRATAPLRIMRGGIPRAAIVKNDATFSTQLLQVGETLYFTTTVENTGAVPIRTHGPEPGTTYTSAQNYNAFGEPISDGSFRLGLDYEGSYVANGFSYPFRWQLGQDEELTLLDGEKYLMPGQTVTITGALTLLEPPPRESPAFWVGLIHENVQNVADRIGWTYITIDR